MPNLLRALFGLRRAIFGASKPGPAPAPTVAQASDPRLADPWLQALLSMLGDRYRLGEDGPDGTQLLRRTGRARFNPLPVWLRVEGHCVSADYEVRTPAATALDEARRLLDVRVTPRLGELGLIPLRETVEEWAGSVLTRRYQGSCPEVATAAAAVRFICVESDVQMNIATE